MIVMVMSCDDDSLYKPDPNFTRGVRIANIAGHRGVLFLPESDVAFGPYRGWSPTDADLASVEAGLDDFLRGDPNWPIQDPERYLRQYWGIYDGGQEIRIRLYCREWEGWTGEVLEVVDNHQCYPEVLCSMGDGRCFRIN